MIYVFLFECLPRKILMILFLQYARKKNGCILLVTQSSPLDSIEPFSVSGAVIRVIMMKRANGDIHASHPRGAENAKPAKAHHVTHSKK
tara:strand:- start:265 stop:531 length:267 start_codon:yes stop_codon:yes gene_type:complete